jgi:PAS domain S-box-containing protein
VIAGVCGALVAAGLTLFGTWAGIPQSSELVMFALALGALVTGGLWAALAPVARLAELTDALVAGAPLGRAGPELAPPFGAMAAKIGALVRRLAEGEERLRGANDELKASLQSFGAHFPGVIFRRAANPDGSARYLYISPSVKRYHGVSAEEIYADPRAIFRNVAPEQREPLFTEMARQHQRGAPTDYTFRIRGGDGVERWMRGSARPRVGGDGELVWDGIAIDVSELKEAQARAEAAQATAEEASAARLVFFAAMSHEIRTPMNAIVGFTRLALGDQSLSAERRRQLTMVSSAAENLLVIINNLLDFAKGESGRLTLLELPFDPRELLEGVVGLLAPEARRKGIELTAELDPGLPRALLADEARLRQILINLIGNAVKFTEQGGVKVQVQCAGVTPTSAHLRISVADTGIGIAPQALSRLFTPFTQAYEASAVRYGGTGLGLNISKQIAELMGGKLVVESTLGVGSRFTFAADVKLSTPADVAARRRRERASLVAAVTPRQILVAEDQFVNQELVRAILEQYDHRLTIVDNGEEAVAAVAKGGFDIVLMDIQMPVMDGLTATRRIRASGPRGERLPIVAVTAQALQEDIERCVQVGASDVVTKPIDPNLLIATIERLTAGASMLQKVVDNADAGGAQSEQILDGAVLGATAGMGDPRRFQDLLRHFTAMIEQTMGRLRAAADAGDAVAMAADAHKLAGSVGSFGLMALGQACRDLERAAEGGVTDLARAQLAKVEALFVDSMTALAAWSDRSAA